jgi:hypothetical protein
MMEVLQGKTLGVAELEVHVQQGTSRVLRLSTSYPYKVLSLSTKPEVS